MTLTAAIPVPDMAKVPRADGELRVAVKARGTASVLDRLYQRGALKLVFPRSLEMTGVLVNTAGGVTGGDRFATRADVAAECALTLTTQAAERAYRAIGDIPGRIRTELSVAPGGRLRWLPQETIVFDGAHLQRHLVCRAEAGAEALLVEPMIFGRTAMGEDRITGHIRDRIELWQGDVLRHLDAWEMRGDLTETLARPAVADGAGAMCSLTYLGPRAEHFCARLRACLPARGGISLKAPDLMVGRVLAKDGYGLRQSLMPMLDILTDNTLPTCWRL